MDLALVAATALGAVSLYLMLPREKTSLVKLGGLLGALTLGGFFIYLVRWSHQTSLTAGGPGTGIYFYIFSAIAIAGAVGVVCHPKPVYSALYFVLLTLASAGLFVLLYAQFMATVLIIVYAGAILVTYVFVIMLASGNEAQEVIPLYDRLSGEPLMAVLVSFVLLGTVMQVMFYPGTRGFINRSGQLANADTRMTLATGPHPTAHGVPQLPAGLPATAGHANADGVLGNHVTSIQALGVDLYSHFDISLEVAGILLTVSLVGAVMIARKNEADAPLLGTGQVPIE